MAMKLPTLASFHFKIESDYLPDRRVCTEENSYCEDDCHVLSEGKLPDCLVLNERKLLGCRTDEISSCWHDLRARYSDFFIQYTMRSCPHLRTLC